MVQNLQQGERFGVAGDLLGLVDEAGEHRGKQRAAFTDSLHARGNGGRKRRRRWLPGALAGGACAALEWLECGPFSLRVGECAETIEQLAAVEPLDVAISDRLPMGLEAVPYTHLTLPTNQAVSIPDESV